MTNKTSPSDTAAPDPLVDLAIAANLASRYSIEEIDGIKRHPSYSEAIGDGHFDVGIYLPRINREYGEPTMRAILGEQRMIALAAITGANYSVDGLEWRIWAKGSATDFEEDRSYYSDINIGLMNLTSADYGQSTYVGVLLKARLYPLGVDPLTVEDRDTRNGWCTSCEKQHPFAPFTPPARLDLDSLGEPIVIVKIAPRGWYAATDSE